MDNPQHLIRVMPAKGNEFDSDTWPLLHRFPFGETVFLSFAGKSFQGGSGSKPLISCIAIQS